MRADLEQAQEAGVPRPKMLVLENERAFGWPKSDAAPREEKRHAWRSAQAPRREPSAHYAAANVALTVFHYTDAHTTAYSVETVPHRLNKKAPAEIEGGVPMVLLILDCDDLVAHRDHTKARKAWRAEMQPKLDALLARHPGAFIYETNGGFRVVYWLAEPFVIRNETDALTWRRTYAQWVLYLSRAFGIEFDPKCGDWTHLFRLPRVTRRGVGPQKAKTTSDANKIGEWAYPSAGEDIDLNVQQARDLAAVDKSSAERWEPVIKLLTPKVETPRTLPPSVPRTPRTGTREQKYRQGAVDKAVREVRAAGTGNRNNSLNNEALAIGRLVIGTTEEEQAKRALRTAAINNGLGESEVEATLASAWGAAAALPRREIPEPRVETSQRTEVSPHLEAERPREAIDAQPTPSDRPVIEIDADRFDVTVRRAAEAFAKHPTTYARDGQLVTVLRAEPTDGGPPAGSPQIRALNAASVRERLHECAAIAQYDGRKKALTHKIAPDTLVQALVHRGDWPGARILVGVRETPFVRRDGTICQSEGYDRATGYVYLPSGEFPRVAERPTRADADSAMRALKEVFCDFKFATYAQRSAVIATILTIVARPAIAGPIPMLAIDASTPGSGKTLAMHAIVKIATGRKAFPRPWSPNEEENRKALLAALAEGDATITYDNIKCAVESAALDAVLTATDYRDRELGKTHTVTTTNTAQIIGTGNGLQIGGDLPRRVVKVEVLTECEDPENRTGWTHPDLLEWIDAERPRLVHAALTLLRAWFVDGAPSMGVKPLGSFEAYSAIIPAVMMWAGEPNPLDARMGTTESPTRDALVVILDWLDGRRLSAAAIAGAVAPARGAKVSPMDANPLPEVRAAFETLLRGREINAGNVGYALRGVQKRIVGGRRVVGDAARAGVKVWTVETVSSVTSNGGDGGDGGDVSSATTELSVTNWESRPGDALHANHPNHRRSLNDPDDFDSAEVA